MGLGFRNWLNGVQHRKTEIRPNNKIGRQSKDQRPYMADRPELKLATYSFEGVALSI